MITPSSILNKYRSVERFLEPARERVRQSILVLCDESGYAHVSRVKTLESLSEKIETGRFRAWSALDDLVAFTVVLPTLSEESRVLSFLRDTFETVDIRARGTTLKAPDVFCFDSTRFVGRLKSVDESQRTPFNHIVFEVQLRSAFEHAWAVTTHKLTYKAQTVDWNQLRLTAQLKAAVEQLDTLILAFEGASQKIQPSVWPEIEAKEALRQFMESAVATGQIPVELTPKDWSRYLENAFRLVKCGGVSKPENIRQTLQNALAAELTRLGTGNIPLSLSLWQFTLASLYESGQIRQLANHWPLITPELEQLYPVMRTVTERFDYS